jgi:hypothetical protein
MTEQKKIVEVTELVNMKSSNIANIAFDEPNELMFVTFTNNSIYSYRKTPKEEFERMKKAESVGKYFNTIKTKYEFEKLDVELKLKKVKEDENNLTK